VRQPKVFLFEEPLSNRDTNLRVQMRTKISRLRHQLQTTMTCVTRDRIEEMSMGDRIVVMKDGVVQHVDTPLNIYHQPVDRFVAGFIGSPAMNLMQGSPARNAKAVFQQERSNLAPRPCSGGTAPQRLQQARRHPRRPEHIYARRPAGTEALVPFKAQIEVVGPVGNDVFLYSSTYVSTQHVARIATDAQPPVGKPYELLFDTSKAHFFDSHRADTVRLGRINSRRSHITSRACSCCVFDLCFLLSSRRPSIFPAIGGSFHGST
jgi:multiple sugar transport system ATP-binding protein